MNLKYNTELKFMTEKETIANGSVSATADLKTGNHISSGFLIKFNVTAPGSITCKLGKKATSGSVIHVPFELQEVDVDSGRLVGETIKAEETGVVLSISNTEEKQYIATYNHGAFRADPEIEPGIVIPVLTFSDKASLAGTYSSIYIGSSLRKSNYNL
jgi:hypothetical protein